MAEELSLGAKLLVGFTQLLATVHCVREYLVDLSVCSGPSMIPTISSEGEVGERRWILESRDSSHKIEVMYSSFAHFDPRFC